MNRFVDAGLAWLTPVEEAEKFYSEDQPRDEQGRWTDTGGGSAAAKEAEGVALYRKTTELSKEELEAQRARNREITRKWREKKKAEKEKAGGVTPPKPPPPPKPEPEKAPEPEPKPRPSGDPIVERRADLNAMGKEISRLPGVSNMDEMHQLISSAHGAGVRTVVVTAEPKITWDHPSSLDVQVTRDPDGTIHTEAVLHISYDKATGRVNGLLEDLNPKDLLAQQTARNLVDEIRRQQRAGYASEPKIINRIPGDTRSAKNFDTVSGRVPAEHMDSLSSITFNAKDAAGWAGRWMWSGAIEMGKSYHASEKVLLHETGHHVHLFKMTDAAAEEWNRISKQTPKAERISHYAGKNRGEHFAEVYSAYFGKPGDRDEHWQGHWFIRENLKKREPLAYDFMERLMTKGSGMLLPNGKTASNPHERYKVTRRTSYRRRYRGW